MYGVTTALVVYILLGQAFPSLIKNKTQYYLAIGAVMVIIFMDALAHVAPNPAFDAFVYFINCILEIAGLIFLILASGGLSPRDFAGEIGDVIEVIRRGETKKEVIVPLSEQARQRTAETPRAKRTDDSEAKVYTIDDPAAAVSQPAPTPPPPKEDRTGPLPLD